MTVHDVRSQRKSYERGQAGMDRGRGLCTILLGTYFNEDGLISGFFKKSKYNFHTISYKFQVYNILIQYFYALLNDSHDKCCYTPMTYFITGSLHIYFPSPISPTFQPLAILVTDSLLPVSVSPFCFVCFVF